MSDQAVKDAAFARAYPSAGKRVTVAPVKLLQSPAFTTEYPRIINPELLDPGAKTAMEESWNRRTFEARPIEVFSIPDAYVIDECLIIDRNLQVVSNASDVYSEYEVDRAVADIRRRLEAGNLPHLDGLGVVSKRRAVANYGHFLMEMLPMAVMGRSLFGEMNPRYVIHRVPPPMQDVMFRSFRLLGFDLNRLLVADDREPVLFQNVIVLKGLTQHGTYMSPISAQVAETMATLVTPGQSKKIFVTRVPGWERGRVLLNQQAVATRLVAKGFTVVEPGSLSLDEQISVFRGADVVVGASGAAMTNIAFCKPGTLIALLVPARFPDTFFWFIATHKRLNYLEIRADQVAMLGPESWKADFSISEADIQWLETLGTPADRSATTFGSSPAETAIAPVEPHSHAAGDAGPQFGNQSEAPNQNPAMAGFGVTPQISISHVASQERIAATRARADAPLTGAAERDTTKARGSRQTTAVPAVGVLAHVQNVGDVHGNFGAWVGTPGSRKWIEGFCVTPAEDIAPEDLQYKAVFDSTWSSPWMASGRFCGSRGVAVPILGFGVRLRDAAASGFVCEYSATFVDGSVAGPVGDETLCQADSLAPLEAIRIVVRRR